MFTLLLVLEMSADQFFHILQADVETAPKGEGEIVGIITDQAEAVKLLEFLAQVIEEGE
jgi:hypothetical protein